ncbi:hypothetical protein V6N11_071290 [Hibiscus sabdariffa]|uniref:Uncharacterized protein n=1 Tax=Hibiscus sabdariffa TaxID=183260 RepID=A0ABR2U0C5_9ROSI
MVRRVEVVVDAGKVDVLNTCAMGWCKEPISIRLLAVEMKAEGLARMEIIWVVESMLVGCFLRVDSSTEEFSLFERSQILIETGALWLDCRGCGAGRVLDGISDYGGLDRRDAVRMVVSAEPIGVVKRDGLERKGAVVKKGY